jgi:membrane protease YdiL (CAAX protease family)
MSSDPPPTELACRKCGETSPAHFSICWNCGETLENASPVEPTEREVQEDERLDFPQYQLLSPPASYKKTAWIELIAVLLVTLCPQFLAILFGASGEQRLISTDYLLSSLPHRIGLTVILWLLIRRDQFLVQPVYIRECRWPIEVLMALVICAVNWCLRVIVAFFAYNIFAGNGAATLAVTFTSGSVKAAYSIGLLFSAAYEEVLFRVYLQSKLQALLNRRVAISVIISAALFAMVHGYSLRGTLSVFAVGIFYGAVYENSRRVPRLVLGHWLHNLIVVWR